ncbi:hypothetical protein AMATHDRAFT_1125 [Amanita thiersii Skay4041]|uniref:Uncharacterized protein n=1 Tax=Amanita thiersii Skay4041 TaxID=703135 RepID=A0A2A9NVQ8_9AGAR|nr:hypothetical protein AMATHDRAFT_1125 [Amanita thiersii Skay4041]
MRSTVCLISLLCIFFGTSTTLAQPIQARQCQATIPTKRRHQARRQMAVGDYTVATAQLHPRKVQELQARFIPALIASYAAEKILNKVFKSLRSRDEDTSLDLERRELQDFSERHVERKACKYF